MATTQTFTGALVVIGCGECGVTFGLDEDHQAELQKSHRTFYCPNGHARHYPAESDAERYKRLYHEAERRAGLNYDDAEAAKRSLRATRGVVTRIRNRVRAGACPFGCRRHFADLERHIASKHPAEAEPREPTA